MVLKKDLMSFCLWLGGTLKLTEFLVVYALLEGFVASKCSERGNFFKRLYVSTASGSDGHRSSQAEVDGKILAFRVGLMKYVSLRQETCLEHTTH